ncbi:hypothetical protein GCM10023335_35310 [Streptomyces siamensis]|uniref:Uncharacterized protein n=1 Tax=Streptomyces siamensis TaxID=1274986 RepID=A0ABP9IXR1_9ACTN
MVALLDRLAEHVARDPAQPAPEDAVRELSAHRGHSSGLPNYGRPRAVFGKAGARGHRTASPRRTPRAAGRRRVPDPRGADGDVPP